MAGSGNRHSSLKRIIVSSIRSVMPTTVIASRVAFASRSVASLASQLGACAPARPRTSCETFHGSLNLPGREDSETVRQ